MEEKRKVSNETIEKRNKRLIEFFKYKNFNIRLIGDKNSPAVIFDNDMCVSCYVHNFDLILTDKPFKGKVIMKIKLKNDINLYEETDKTLFNTWIETAEHRAIHLIYIITLNQDKLYLCGYNKNDVEELYPVFSKHNPKIYFSLETATKVVSEYKEYDLLISNS